LNVCTFLFYPTENSTEKIGDFASSNANSEMIKRIATKLDKKSRVNGYWWNLGEQFEISREKLKEIEYGPSNPTLVLMKYLYLKQEDLTVGRFYKEVKKLKRGDVLEKLEPFLKGTFLVNFPVLTTKIDCSQISWANYFILCCIWLSKLEKYSSRWLDIAQGIFCMVMKQCNYLALWVT